jgi:hypothetical protein
VYSNLKYAQPPFHSPKQTELELPLFDRQPFIFGAFRRYRVSQERPHKTGLFIAVYIIRDNACHARFFEPIFEFAILNAILVRFFQNRVQTTRGEVLFQTLSITLGKNMYVEPPFLTPPNA